ncbi:FGGY-family carbohydrate kinase [Aquihabitans sp. G128]|uniref:xylulokinase n=1 Tax=Aquihabitans sp. G128 TaxID=2849779 RepID=UPI001C216FB6|nr:FGGY-family carbohydrate kinase [Aquihabitans sp. G128]QXC60936.1 FGGY-family carbohydrate kinase [Aquihabitans sp. G128]
MGDEHVLAIDLGTGGPKAALVDSAGHITAHEFEATPIELLGEGGAEQDPDAWWAAITAAVQRVVGAGHVAVDDIVAVSITSQWSGTVAVDVAGKHLHPAVIWMDSRGAPYIEEVIKGRLNVAGYDARRLQHWISRTGGIPSHSGKDPVAHILWLRNERPDVYRSAHAFLEPCDYLNARVTGRQVASYDSIVAHWLTDNRDLSHVRYDPQLLAWCGLTEAQLPELVPSASTIGTVLPSVAEAWGISTATKVVTATGDVHSAVVGSGALGDHEGHLYMGTSSWLSCHLPAKKTDLLNNQAALPSAVPGRYFLANEHEVGAGALLWLRDQAQMVRDVEEANELAAASVPGSHGVIFTPWLNGERTPVDDHTIRGGWNNVSLTTNRPDLVRSVFEGVAYNSRWLLDTVERFVKQPMDGLNFIGGGARSDLWCQVHADVCDRTIRRVAEPQHANARGAAFVAWLALGRQTLDELNRAVTIEREFTPDPTARAAYAPLYKEFLKLYKAHKPIHARLNG